MPCFARGSFARGSFFRFAEDYREGAGGKFLLELSFLFISTLTEVPFAILMLHVMTMSERVLMRGVIIIVELDLSDSIVHLHV